jgi:hypothetical protein
LFGWIIEILLSDLYSAGHQIGHLSAGQGRIVADFDDAFHAAHDLAGEVHQRFDIMHRHGDAVLEASGVFHEQCPLDRQFIEDV